LAPVQQKNAAQGSPLGARGRQCSQVRHDAHPESAEFRGIQRTQHLVGRDPKLGGIRCNAVQISRRPQPAVAVVGALGEFPRNSVPHGGGTKALYGHESESAPKTPTAQLNHGHAKQCARREVGGKKSDQKNARVHVGFQRNHQERGQCEQQARLAYKASKYGSELDPGIEAVGLPNPAEQEPKDAQPLRKPQVVVKVSGIFGL